MVRFTTEERLQEIIDEHEAMGAMIFNPHRYTLEEGGMKQTDAVQLAFKRETDPQGLLNPGKMIAWEDPNFDFAAGKKFLFPGPRGARARRGGLRLLRILVLFAHPVETSFGAAVHAKLVATLRARGHEIDDCDLNAEGFDPVMSRQDRHRISRRRASTAPRRRPTSIACSRRRRSASRFRSGTWAFPRS